VVRSFGSSVLWTYITLLIQLQVPSEVQGRIFAIERAVDVLFAITSFLLCAFLFDTLYLDERGASFVMLCVGIIGFLLWVAMYIFQYIRDPKISTTGVVYSALSVVIA
jgi:hypothetical protein